MGAPADRSQYHLLLESMADVDRELAALPDAMVAEIRAAGNPINIYRSEHRAEHTDAIERTLAG